MAGNDPEKDCLPQDRYSKSNPSAAFPPNTRENTSLVSFSSKNGSVADDQAHANPQLPGLQAASSQLSSHIPRSQMRGLFARFTVIAEVKEPHFEYNRRTKWFITFVDAMASIDATSG